MKLEQNTFDESVYIHNAKFVQTKFLTSHGFTPPKMALLEREEICDLVEIFSLRGAGAVLVRIKMLRCGFASAGAVKFFGAGNNINDL